MILLLLACAPKPDPRPLAALPPVVEAPPPPPVVVPDPLPAWRSGFSSAPALPQRVAEAWGHTLRGPVTEPVAADANGAFAVADGRLVAFAADGKRAWEARIDATGGPTLLESAVIAGSGDGRVHWVDRATGRDTTVTDKGAPVVGAVVAVDGGFAWLGADGTVTTTAGWTVSTQFPPSGRPAADGGTVYFASTNAQLHAVTAKGISWSTTLPAPPVGGPALDADRAYVSYGPAGGEPGGVVAIWRSGESAGKEAWRFATGFGPEAAPAVYGAVFVPDKDGNLYALDPVTGGQRWACEGYGAFTTQPVVTKKALYAGNGDGNLYAIDTFDGGLDWKVDLGAPVASAPVIVGDGLVVGLANGRVLGLRP